jgi:hypothetical protein
LSSVDDKVILVVLFYLASTNNIGGGVLMNKTFGNINLDLLESMKWLQSESLVKGVQKFLK